MVKAVQGGLRDSRIRLFAEPLVKHLKPHDYISEYAAVLNWVRCNIRYTRDPVNAEQLKTPAAILETGTGDCDEMAILIATLVGVLGGRVRFVAGAFRLTALGEPEFSHVWCEAFEPASKAWVVLDPVPGRNVASMLRRLQRSLIMEAA